MEKLYILNKECINKCDPHGYFTDFGSEVVNFKSPTKRSFLNECIRQIYIQNGKPMPILSNPAEFNKGLIWNTLNTLMAPKKMSIYQASVERVKRRLFIESKQKPRKFRQPKFNDSQISECSYFKTSRHIVGVRKIQRNYLEQARQLAYNELRQNLKRKYCDEDENDVKTNSAVNVNTNEGVFQVSQQDINKVCRYHSNMARHHPQRERSMEEQLKRERNTEACRLSRRAKKLEEMLVEQQYRERFVANEKTLEASIRSILYMKTLMGLMAGQVDDRNNLYI